MNSTILLWCRGALIGFAIAAPVGPIGILVIRRTVALGRTAGLLSGLGAATADCMYGCVAAFGLTTISNVIIGQSAWIRLFGGLFLVYLGVSAYMARPAKYERSADSESLLGAYSSTAFLTVTNPATLLSFAAIFAGLGMADLRGNYVSASMLVLGVFIGSAVWWLLLSTGVSVIRERLSDRGLQWINRISGIVLGAFGLSALMSVIVGLFHFHR